MALAVRLLSGLLLSAALATAAAAQERVARGVLKSVYAHAEEDCLKDKRFAARQGVCAAYATCVQTEIASSVPQEQAMAAVHDKDVKLGDSLPLRRWQSIADRCGQKVTSEYTK
jgi:hypothetical protein